MTRSPAWLSFRWLSSKIIGSWRLWISGSWKNVSKQLSGPLFIAKSVIDKNFAMWLMASLVGSHLSFFYVSELGGLLLCSVVSRLRVILVLLYSGVMVFLYDEMLFLV